MKILITGASGFLGKELKLKLSDNHFVYSLSRKGSDYNIDLSKDFPKFDKNFDVVIHAAGLAHINTNINYDFEKVNIVGTENLLKGLGVIEKPQKFVFISSVSVYGLIEGENITETHPLLAKDPYGNSKIKAEEIIQNWCHEHNIICTILRLPLIVGESPPGNLGIMIAGIKKGYYFNIAGGIARKSMVLVTDIAQFILSAADKGGIYNLTDGHHPSFQELSKNIASQVGKNYVANMPIFLAKILAKFGDILGNKFPFNSTKLIKITSTLTFDDTKARVAFGWNPYSILENFKISKDV